MRCKVLSQQSEDNDLLHDPESVEIPHPQNDRSRFFDSASFSSSDCSDANNSEENTCEDRDINMFEDEVEMTVEDYVKNLTNESRQEILYNPEVVLRYMA